MKKLLSNLSGRLMSMFFSAALVVSFLVPANVLAYVGLSTGGGEIGSTEGDPLDTNDYGGGRSGDGSDIYDPSTTKLLPKPSGFELGRIQILLVPEFVGGTLIFKIMIVDEAALGMRDLSPEGTHAP